MPQNLSFYNATGPINTDLKGLTALQDLQQIVTYAGEQGLKVILDDHRSEAGESAEANGLWYTSTYTSQDWVNDWVTLARMFAGNPTVVGFDLRNEPHTPAATLRPGRHLGHRGRRAPTSGWPTSRPGTRSWPWTRRELLRGRQREPDLLGRHQLHLAGGTGRGPPVPGHAQLAGARGDPRHHDGPNLFEQTWFNSSTTPASLAAVWNANWGYLYTQDVAPVWVGEFGTDNTAADVASSAAGSQGQWFESLVSYLSANPWMGWTYWALNGEDSYDLLDGSYDATPVSAAKQSELASSSSPCPAR